MDKKSSSYKRIISIICYLSGCILFGTYLVRKDTVFMLSGAVFLSLGSIFSHSVQQENIQDK